MKLKCLKSFDYDNHYWVKGKRYEVDWYSETTITLVGDAGRWHYFIWTSLIGLEALKRYKDARNYFDLTPIKLDEQLILIRTEIGL